MSRSYAAGLATGVGAVVAMLILTPASAAADAFPFGLEMTLDAPAMPGSKRRPTLEIGDAGETRVELWCKGGKGQFSVAGESVVFLPGAMEDRACTPAQAQLDDGLLAALSTISTWRRRGDLVSFGGGAKPLQFQLNTN